MNRIVLAVKAGEQQPWLADAAVQLARETDASVAVVSLDGVEAEVLSSTPRDEVERLAREAAQAAAERIGAAGVPVSSDVRRGNIARGILLFAEEQGADLVVVGASSRGPVASRLLGSVPMQLVARSRRPVLVITPPAEGEGG